MSDADYEENPEHRALMERALRLARLGSGRASPNPLVGCVVVRDGEIIGEGFHVYADVRHAEALALEQAGERARGADLYVNLEPCCHQGRTPPCTDLIVKSGIGRVFVAVRDRNPLVSGKGVERLRAAGIEVHEELLAEAASRLNEAFFHYISNGCPFALLRLAMTLDGKIATSTGHSQWITGRRARSRSHHLRYQYDALLVGVKTLLQDDPSLTVRWRRRNRLTRVVLDSHLRTPPGARLFAAPDPVIIFHAEDASSEARRRLQDRAVLVTAPVGDRGLVWDAILKELGSRRVTSLIIEGGSRVAASALAANIVRKVCFFYAPKIIGGGELSGVGDLGVRRLDQAVRLHRTQLRSLPPDFVLEGYVDACRD